MITRGGKKYKELNKELCSLLENVRYDYYPDTGIALPPTLFNAVFLTYHALTHFLSEGLRVRQVIDWAMFLRVQGSKIDWNQLYALCDKYGFTTFLNVMNFIAVDDFGVVIHDTSMMKFNKDLKDKVLNSLLDGDYVFSNRRGAWHNRFSIIRNLFKDRWKYKDIYNKSIFIQLFEYLVGFILKRE